MNARPELGQQLGLRPLDIRQFSTVKHKHPVRTFGIHALPRAICPLFVSGNGADIFRPSRNDIVGAENVLAAFGSGNRGESRPGFLALRLCQDSAMGITHHDNKRDRENNEK